MLAACTTAFTACNNEESLPDTGNQLKLSFGINAPQSRAIFTDTKLPDSSPVGVTLDGYADYANLVYTGTTTSGKQTWTPDKQVRLSDTQGTLYAYYPYSSTTSINAIDIDMTAADQTDWLYATPVTGICEDKAEAAVTMNHALANINVTVNKGTYLGEGNISNITMQSDGIALGGTFNAAQATPDYTAFENEGEPLSRDLTTTAGAAATDIMVVPTGTSAAVTFLLTIDGIQFTAKSADVTLEKGNSYQYTLNLSDISAYMTIGSFSVTPWGTNTKDNLDLRIPTNIDVYAMSATGELIDYTTADATAKGVVVHATGKNFDKKFMIAKSDATYNGSDYQFEWFTVIGSNIQNIIDYSTVDGTNATGHFNGSNSLSDDFTTWKNGVLSDFEGKSNSANNKGSSSSLNRISSVLQHFNDGINFNENQNYIDWYIPAAGQLALMYLVKTEIEAALEKIGGEAFDSGEYWSSSEYDSQKAWVMDFRGNINTCLKGQYNKRRVRFIRDIMEGDTPMIPQINSTGIVNGVYVITATGQLVDKLYGNENCIGVALITDNQRIMIPKFDAEDGENTNLYWGYKLYMVDVTDIISYNTLENAKSDFSGKTNTRAIISTYKEKAFFMQNEDMCRVLNYDNEAGYTDWYIPALGQMYEIYTNMTAIKEAMNVIGGTEFTSKDYWTSSECGYNGWSINLGNGNGNYYSKSITKNVRFVRDIN